MNKYSDSIEARFTGRYQKCIDLCGGVKGKRILNIGCYNGWFEQAMIKKGANEVVGIDTNEKFVQTAKRNVPGAKFFGMSALSLNFPQNYFDLVTMFDVIEHLPKSSEIECLKGISRVLKNKSKLVISVPNNHFLARILDPAWWLVGHRHYNLRQIEKLVGKTGLKVEKVEYGGRFYELVSMILLYIFKWVFKSEMPFKTWFDRKREEEYLRSQRGFATIFWSLKNE